MKKQSDSRLINLAIVKLKLEDTFISFKINKFVLFLFDFNLITENEYLEFIYGTTDKIKIEFTKYGMNGSLIYRLEKDKQLQNIDFDANGNLVGNNDFNRYKEQVDVFYKYEIERFL